MKRRVALGLIVSAAFLALALRGIDRAAFVDALRSVEAWPLVPAVAFTLLGHMSRAWRWQWMMNPVRRIGWPTLWSATAIAFMANNLLPARMGELVRAWVIGRRAGVPKSAAFATIVYERVVDVFALIFLLWFCLVRIGGPEWLRRSAWLLVALNVGLLAALAAMLLRRSAFVRVVEWATRPLPPALRARVLGMADAFVDGLGVVTEWRALGPIVLLSVPVWGFAMLGVHWTLVAMHMPRPPMASVFVVVLVSLGSMIPSAPAYVGPLQYACVVALAAWGIDRSDAIAMSTVYHATQFFPITLVGAWYAWREGMRPGDFASRRE